MTEKRYYRTFVNLEDNQHNPYYNIRDKSKEGNNIVFMVVGKYTSKDIVDKLNEQEERIKELEYELSAFKPVVFQDTRIGTVLLYAKDYGDVE